MTVGGGRKPKSLDGKERAFEEYMTEICAHLVRSISITDSCRGAGLNPRTLYNWLEYEKQGRPEFQGLQARIDAACVEGQKKLLGFVEKAAPKDWKAAAWILERRNPEYRRQTDVTVQGGDKPIQFEGMVNMSWSKAAEDRLAVLLAKRQEIEDLKTKHINNIL